MKTLTFCLALIIMSCTLAFGQATEKVLWSFGSVPNDGNRPTGSLISDSAGNLYGTTAGGGTGGGGTVYELTPQSDGTWNETILYNFCATPACIDGWDPQGGLTFDAAGNLYGTTEQGGTQTGCGSGGECGTVFEISQEGGVWAETVLYNFCSSTVQNNPCADGFNPFSQLIFDASGNLYGTTAYGGRGRSNVAGGTVFELSPNAGVWTEKVLYSFCSKGSGIFCPDGQIPQASVTFDKSGNLFGTTLHGGRYKTGILYELTAGGSDWTETVLVDSYNYPNTNASVNFDSAGNLYGTTEGNAFQLNQHTQSMRTRNFNITTGYASEAGVLIDATRNVLFGTASVGGANGGGTVWEVNIARELVPIYSFCSLPACADGSKLFGGLIEDPSGNLYGTTTSGGAYGNGVVFEITP